jgi:hypothetical protein
MADDVSGITGEVVVELRDADGKLKAREATYGPGKATTASPITEAVIVIDTLADATSTAANTVSRVLLTGIGSKASTDTLTVTWTHKLLGA